jgi:hypothetical protein
MRHNHPAFPVQAYAGDDRNPPIRSNSGMSFADWLAGMAMQGILSNPELADATPPKIAELAYKLAFAMLDAREQK